MLTLYIAFIFQLPNLAFLAFAGNPCLQKEGEDTPLQTVAWSDLEIGLILGQGASGLIYKAHWASRNQAVAVKVFKGEVTSDGLPGTYIDPNLQYCLN